MTRSTLQAKHSASWLASHAQGCNMVELKHTPGPWRAAEWSCHAATTVLVDDPSIVTGKRVIAECDAEDDAQVIAALPELVDAALAAEAVLARGRWLEGSPDPEAVALYKLRAAIAKATELRQPYAGPLPLANQSLAAGVEHAVSLLCRWQECGEAGMHAAEPMRELFAALASCSGLARDGLLQTIGAFLLLTLEGTPPIVDGWDAEKEIEHWGVPFDDEVQHG
ncbi:hypothetical protein AB4Y42_05445 [Paraburkholderia sp. EG286B]|uniref:hypothetical protein n=1 Tax=Paraburkholderia sp. EG286B TaxID=3237011 RepID=UPI0034D2691C